MEPNVVTSGGSAQKVIISEVAKTASAPKKRATKATPKVEKKAAAKVPAKVALNNKDFNAANKALKSEFCKLSHACKFVASFTKQAIVSALKESGKIEAGKIELIAEKYAFIINAYDLVDVTNAYLSNVGGVHCRRVVAVVEDRVSPEKSFDRTKDLELLAGDFFKPAGFGVAKIATTDPKLPYKKATDVPEKLTISGYVRKDKYTPGDVLEAIKAFIKLGENREQYVARKRTGNSKKAAE